MKKVWIIHSSDTGNSEKVAKQLAGGLEGIYDVSVEHINDISPEKLAAEEPYGLIAAVRIFAFSSDKKMTKYLAELDKVIKKSVSKLAYFSTHAMKWKNLFIRGMKKTLNNMSCVEEVCPDFLEVRLQGAKGPAREGADEKIESYISSLKEFLA